MRFRKTRRGIEGDPDEVEAAVLRRCVEDLLVLLGDEDPEQRDPLASLVGLVDGDPERPADPALARLLPDAYGDDEAASRDFRRYTDGDLRAGKRANATVVLETLPERGGRTVLDRPAADAWLACLNDLRLVLGTRLGVTEETDPDDLDEQDPRRQGLHVYGWLGWMQESLLQCLMARS